MFLLVKSNICREGTKYVDYNYILTVFLKMQECLTLDLNFKFLASNVSLDAQITGH